MKETNFLFSNSVQVSGLYVSEKHLCMLVLGGFCLGSQKALSDLVGDSGVPHCAVRALCPRPRGGPGAPSARAPLPLLDMFGLVDLLLPAVRVTVLCHYTYH